MKKILFIITISLAFTAISQEKYNSNWKTFGYGIGSGEIKCFYEDTVENLLIVGGVYKYIDSVYTKGLSMYDGTSWQKCHNLNIPSYGYTVSSIIKYKDTLYIGGNFWTIWNGDTIGNIAKWDGTNWTGLPFLTGAIRNMRIIDDKLYILTDSVSVNGMQINHILIYDGEHYSAFDPLPPDYLYILTDITYYKNEYYVGGEFNNSDYSLQDIIKFNGTEWSDVGGSLKGGMAGVNKMIVYNDELIVAGSIWIGDGNAGNSTQKWNGEEWSPFINMRDEDFNYNTFSDVFDMKIHNDKLYISGMFSYANDMPCNRLLVYHVNEICTFINEVHSGPAGPIGFYNDTLIIANIDSIEHVDVNRIAKWVGGENYDTCSVLQFVQQVNNEVNNIMIYPNPTNSTFNIKLNTKTPLETQISIFSINGSKIFEKQFYQTNEIRINNLHLEKGVYFMKIKTDEFVKAKKLIINWIITQGNKQ